ncbi:MAG: hypothetical protein DMF78_02075, partial [Acidobacteria bacterium]
YPALIAGGVVGLLLLGAHLLGARGALSPGGVTTAHSTIDTQCEQCHTPGRGVSNIRCQRCHDPSSAGRLTAAAHVLFGSSDPRKAAAAPDLACARCHVEHRGRRASLDRVEDVQCARCHFGSLGSHPEFAVLRSSTRAGPGLKFGHQKHVEEVMKQSGLASAQTCLQCHQKRPTGRDFDPISFDLHCASCHAKEGSIGSADPVPLTDVVDLEGLRARGVPGVAALRPEEFETARGKVARPSLRHRDPWVLFNLDKLRAESDPDGYAAERARLQARIASLERRLAAATPLAGLDRNGLEQRAAALESESRGAAQRLAAVASGADVRAGAERLGEVEARLRAVGDGAAAEEVARLRGSAGASGPGPAPLGTTDFEARRREVLALLDSVEAADPALRPRAQDLRRRLVSLVPGENAADVLARVRDQRQAALARVRDELRLRDQGVAPPRAVLLDADRRELEGALAEARAQLASRSVPAAMPLAPEEQQRRRETANVLAAACAKCHVLSGAALDTVRAARPVLVRARFEHAPHLLQADCARCHAGIEASTVSRDLNFKGIQSCRECHRSFRVSQDCRECHLFHPRVVP